MRTKAKRGEKSRVLVCYDCRFQKAVKNDVEALIITRNHNLGRDVFDKKHVMSVLDWEETHAVNSLPYYKGFVYRAVCDCGKIFDRKTRRAVEYAMELHIKTSDAVDALGEQLHQFQEYGIGGLLPEEDWKSLEKKMEEELGPDIYEYDEEGDRHVKEEFNHKYKNIRTIDRKQYVIRSRDADKLYWEQYFKLDLKPSDLATTTAITTYDENIFWSDEISTFNAVNAQVYKYLSENQCPACSKYFRPSTNRGFVLHDNLDNNPNPDYNFRELYWHYYREHYLPFYNELSTKVKLYHDVAISMLQQFVLVEDGLRKRDEKNLSDKVVKFKKDRLSNALYQLNRKHGIPMGDLDYIFNKFYGTANRKVGDALFHGMVWSEKKAPTWLETVIEEYGKDFGI